MKVVTTCKVCRRLGVSVCGREKCALKRKPYPPGVHGKAYRNALSEFGSQLREKQKMRLSYGIREQQFKNYVLNALRQRSMEAPDAIVSSLERRLDNTVFRLGFSQTRSAARQAVSHGHILVNKKKVTVPSYCVRVDDEISVRPQSLAKGIFSQLDISMKKYSPPVWLKVDKETKIGQVIANPTLSSGEGLGKAYDINSIVEYYSR